MRNPPFRLRRGSASRPVATDTMKSHRLFLATAALALAGCVDYEAQPITAVGTGAAYAARRLDDPALEAFLVRDGGADFAHRIWNADALAAAAYRFNPELKLALARRKVAEAAVVTAGGRPNPTLSVSPNYNVNAASGISPWAPAATLDIPIETAGKRDDRIARAEADARSAYYAAAVTARRIRAEVRAALVILDSATRRAELAARTLAVRRELVALLGRRIKAGAVSRAEVFPFESALNASEVDAGDATAAVTEARSRLAEAVGMPREALAGIRLDMRFSDPAKEPVPRVADLAQSEALLKRPDILGALCDYDSAEAALELEVAKQYPDIHLNPGYQWDQGANRWQLGLSVEIPVLNRNQGPIAEAAARRTEARARLVVLQDKIIAETGRALDARAATETQVAAAEVLFASQQESLAAVERLRTAGAADPVDLMLARLDALAAESLRLDRETKHRQAVFLFEETLQLPVTPVVENQPCDWELLPVAETPPAASEKNSAPTA